MKYKFDYKSLNCCRY